MKEGERLNKYLASCGVCSRREADRLIEAGRVQVGGRVASLGEVVTEGDEVCLDGQPLKRREKKVVLAYYKPPGVVVSERDPHAETTVADAIDYPLRVSYAGRLDKDSEGLLLLTNDGELIHAMMQGRFAHEKEYIVHLWKDPSEEDLEVLRAGVYLKDLKKKTRACRIERLRKCVVRMVLREGLNRQIRRMWALRGIRVRALKRTRVVTVSLGDLRPGEYAELTPAQLKELYTAVGL
ncbi:MAG: rRNA pseudouridine synthase [Lachnospiraceae bacterium]|nr:rRNA pseudouridine synthase [Lachnospiraceae bacterium]